jgi:ABC-2 type transport system permease protein
MRGVIEEKSSRIVEVIISSVKPFQLMMGKIIGIAFVAITQFLIWVVLSTVIIGGAQQFFKEELNQVQTEQVKNLESVNPEAAKTAGNENQQAEFISRLTGQLGMINFPLVLGAFLFYFIGGYLLYGSLFAAIGAAVDNETDTQQFMLPVTIPLILAIVMAQVAIENPDGPIAFWASIIPLTSPIIMMIRIPVGVAYWEVILSMGLLIATFIGTTWMAAKIYRTGILMYGKKVNFKEIGKWVIHKS